MVKYRNKLHFTLKLRQSMQPVSNFSFTNLEINLHNFTFSLAARGSEETRTTARGLNNRRHFVTHVT